MRVALMLLLWVAPAMVAGVGWGQVETSPVDVPAPAVKTGPVERVNELTAAFEKQMAEFRDEFRRIKSDEERGAAYEKRPKSTECVAELMKLAAAHPGTDACLEAVQWSLDQELNDEQLQTAQSFVTDHFLNDPRTATLLGTFSRDWKVTAGTFLRHVMEKSTDDTVKGAACFYLAQQIKTRCDMAGYVKNVSDKDKQRMEDYFGKEGMVILAKVDIDQEQAAIEGLLQKVVDDYPEVEGSRGKLADAAQGDLFEIRNLAIGKVAPEIDDEDIFGERFKLSDYRGKVIFLDFWGDW